MKIAIASDHTGCALRSELIDEGLALGYEVADLGPAVNTPADYPVYGELVARRVADGQADLGVLICGTGVGISLAANRVPGIRAVVCSDAYTAKLSRQHNNTNVLAVGARVVGPGLARSILRAWLEAEFHGGRHQERIAMLELISRSPSRLLRAGSSNDLESDFQR